MEYEFDFCYNITDRDLGSTNYKLVSQYLSNYGMPTMLQIGTDSLSK